MTTEEAIKNFSSQFSFTPTTVNAEKIQSWKELVVCGMGGSHLAADLLKTGVKDLSITIHHDYGLPTLPEERLSKSLIVLSSYSGNTEEVVEALNEAIEQARNCVVIATGGELLKIAEEKELPYIQLPETSIQPRLALGYNLMALASLISSSELFEELASLQNLLSSDIVQKRGEELASRLLGKIPLIYSSEANYAVAYNWKIKLNETGKSSAFMNTFPELNHNEIVGFDNKDTELLNNFYVIFLTDDNDHPQIKKRMEATEELYRTRGVTSEKISLEGSTVWAKIFTSLLIADWCAYTLAIKRNIDPERVVIVEELKEAIRR